MTVDWEELLGRLEEIRQQLEDDDNEEALALIDELIADLEKTDGQN